MFEDILFVEFGNEKGAGEESGSLIAALKGVDETTLRKLEDLVRAKMESMTSYDSIDERVQEAMRELGLEFEMIYPDRYIAISFV